MYTNHLHPFLQSNQESIDGYIEEGKRAVKGKLDGVLGGIWSASLGASEGVSGNVSGKDARHKPPASTAPAPPTQHNPAQAPMSMFGNLVKTYAPVAIASAKTFLESKAPPPNPNTTAAYSIPSSTSGGGGVNEVRKREEAMARRKHLESQLAALDGVGDSSSSGESDESQPPMVTMINPKSGRTSFSAQGSLRNRIVSGGRTVKAGQAMGESYDLLDQGELDRSAVGAGLSPTSKGRGWMPWSTHFEMIRKRLIWYKKCYELL